MAGELMPVDPHGQHELAKAAVRDTFKLYALEEIRSMAEVTAASGILGTKDVSVVMAIMMVANADGLHPMHVRKKYHIIDGQPSMRADAMQAEFQARGGKVRWIRFDAEVAEAEFSHAALHPDPITMKITFKEMADAGMTTGRDGIKANWRRSPAAMLRARVISAGVRMIDPGVVAGVYTPEEVMDFEPERLEIPPPAKPSADWIKALREFQSIANKGGMKWKIAERRSLEKYGVETIQQLTAEQLRERAASLRHALEQDAKKTNGGHAQPAAKPANESPPAEPLAGPSAPPAQPAGPPVGQDWLDAADGSQDFGQWDHYWKEWLGRLKSWETSEPAASKEITERFLVSRIRLMHAVVDTQGFATTYLTPAITKILGDGYERVHKIYNDKAKALMGLKNGGPKPG